MTAEGEELICQVTGQTLHARLDADWLGALGDLLRVADAPRASEIQKASFEDDASRVARLLSEDCGEALRLELPLCDAVMDRVVVVREREVAAVEGAVEEVVGKLEAFAALGEDALDSALRPLDMEEDEEEEEERGVEEEEERGVEEEVGSGVEFLWGGGRGGVGVGVGGVGGVGGEGEGGVGGVGGVGGEGGNLGVIDDLEGAAPRVAGWGLGSTLSNDALRASLEVEDDWLHGVEKELVGRLEELRERRRGVRERRLRLQAARRRLGLLERLWWAEQGQHMSRELALRTAAAALRHRTRRTRQELHFLSRLRAPTDALYISHNGSFATINGLRAGSLPREPVPWDEVNAALGYAASALATITERGCISVNHAQITPMGSFSRLTSAARGVTAETLFYDRRAFGPARKLNAALRSFCICVAETAAVARTQDPSLRLPYKLSPERDGRAVTIHGISVEFSDDPAQLPRWTQALKMLLTDIKWLLAWVIRRETNELTA